MNDTRPKLMDITNGAIRPKLMEPFALRSKQTKFCVNKNICRLSDLMAKNFIDHAGKYMLAYRYVKKVMRLLRSQQSMYIVLVFALSTHTCKYIEHKFEIQPCGSD